MFVPLTEYQGGGDGGKEREGGRREREREKGKEAVNSVWGEGNHDTTVKRR